MASAPSSPAGGGLRVLFVSLEFRAAAFSGNGVYAQSQARALAKAGHDVHVVSGVPSKSVERKQSRQTHYPGDPPNLAVTEILLSEDEKWGRLDAECGWREFAERAGPGLEGDLVRGIADFNPDVILGVDWSSLPAARSLSRRVRSLTREDTANDDGEGDENVLIAPFVYSNFRVFTRGNAPEAHAALEADAVAAAREVLALSREDADFVAERLSPPGIAVAPRVVLPPLREDVRALAESVSAASRSSAAADAPSAPERKYLTCCVRLSPEKEPENFLSLCRWLAARDALRGASLVPVLCASTRGEYAASVRSRFRECVRGNEHRIVTEHLDADGLRDLFSATRLNYHPCRRDAYGMTVVEAGAFGAPSVAQRGGGVGATHTLREKDGASLGMDLRMTERSESSGSDDADDDETAHAEVLKHALDAATLARVGAAARRAATAWDEAANADAVARALRDAIDAHRRGDALGDRRWRLPSRSDAERLKPLWRDATLGVWSGGEWVVLQHAAACGETPHAENSPEWRLGRGGARTTTTRVVVVTAHNPMGAPRDAAANDAATRTLLNEARALHEDGVFEDVRPCVSVDAVGGAAAWCEPGLALTLAETNGSNEQAFVAAARLARSHGQAAVYELTGTARGKWTLAVRPVFPGLGGLAVEDAPLVVREPPKSMPTGPEEAGCNWDGETAVLGLR